MHAAVLLLYVLCTIAMTWPLTLQLGTELPAGGDPFKHTWRIAWEAHILTTDPLELYRANSFYSYPDSFAFDDLMLTQGLMTLPLVLATGNFVLAHNLVILISFVLSAYTMFLFGHYLVRNPFAAWLAGLIFAFSTFRLAHFPHMNLLFDMWIPVLFMGVDKLLTKPRMRVLALVVCAGFLQGLSSLMVFYLAFLALGVFVLLGVIWKRYTDRAGLGQLAFAVCAIGLLLLPFALPYYRVAREFAFVRDSETIQALSATLYSYFAVPTENWLLAGPLAFFAHRGNYPHEHELFMGLAALVLVFAALGTLRRNVVTRILFVLGVIALIFSFGPVLYISAAQKIDLPFTLPYQWLYDLLPGFSSLRAGARFALIVSFALAGLACIGADKLLSRAPARRQIAFAGALGIIILVENGIAPIPLQTVPSGDQVAPVYRWLAAQPPNSPVAELPVGGKQQLERNLGLYQYLSSFHWQPILTSAFFSYYPDDYGTLLGFLSDFPSPNSVALLREFDVRYVIVHSSRLSEQERANVEMKLEQQGMTPIQKFGTDWVFEITPAAQDFGALHTGFYVSDAARLDPSRKLYALLTNPTSHLYFFNPARRLEILVNGQLASFELPLFLENGTTIAASTIQDSRQDFQIQAAPNSFLTFPAQSIHRTQETNPTAARPIALQFVDGTVSDGQLKLVWRVRDWIREPYIVHARILDASGNTISAVQAEHRPPQIATARWRPGEMLTDTLLLGTQFKTLPASLELSLYEPGTGTQLIPLDAQGNPIEKLKIAVP